MGSVTAVALKSGTNICIVMTGKRADKPASLPFMKKDLEACKNMQESS